MNLTHELASTFANGHTSSNIPDPIRTRKSSGERPGQYWGGGPPGKPLGCCWLFSFVVCVSGSCCRLSRLTSPYPIRRVPFRAAQLSCHDAPIFRLLLKIAVSLTASNVTFSIFVRLRAANNTPINSSTERNAASTKLRSESLIFLSVRTRRGQPTLPYIPTASDCNATYLAGAGPRSSRWLSIG